MKTEQMMECPLAKMDSKLEEMKTQIGSLIFWVDVNQAKTETH
jgi:hypothetical protein